MSGDQFEMRIQIELNKLDPGGGWTGERMSVNESFSVSPAGFLEIAGILGRFHELAEDIRKERED